MPSGQHSISSTTLKFKNEWNGLIEEYLDWRLYERIDDTNNSKLCIPERLALNIQDTHRTVHKARSYTEL